MPEGRHRVCILVYDNLCVFEYALAAELLQDRTPAFGQAWYELTVCSLESAPARGSGGVRVDAVRGPGPLQTADTILIPGWREGPVPQAMIDGLVEAHQRGARIASICTGAFVLAAAGLLDGRRATIHWSHAARLAADHPAVRVDANVLYVDDGDILTSAGSAAGLDMLLHMIRRDYGTRTCNAVARMMVVPSHREGGQGQYFERPARPAETPAFARVVDALRRDPTRNWSVPDLAASAAMTERTFFRRFRTSMGQTPHDWLISERVRIARALLEDSALSMDRIAYDAGFGGTDVFRRCFRKVVGTTPSEFRRTFRALT